MMTPSIFRSAAVFLLASAVATQAQTDWQAANGVWNVGSNWAGGSVPGPGGFALIANGGTATLGVGVSGTVKTLLVGRANGGTVLINGGYLKTTYGLIGQKFGLASGIGTVTVSNGGVWDVSGPSGEPSFPASIDIGGYGSAGFLNILAGGTVHGDKVKVGETQGGTGTLEISGGVLNVFASSTSVLWVGYENPGIYTQSGGVANLRQITVGSGPGVSGSVAVSSGTMDAVLMILGDRGQGVFTQTGGVVRATHSVVFGLQSGTGTLELSGGTFETAIIEESGAGEGRVKLNGGTLVALGDQSSFFQGFELGDVTIEAGGAFIDTNGHSVGIHDSFTGSGRLTKQGGGLLTLTNANYHLGGTTVKSGTLAISGSAASLLNATDLRIGEGSSDNAVLALSDGAIVSNATTVGFAGDSQGLVTVANGSWTEGSTLAVGYSGAGAVELTNGSIAINGDATLGQQSTGSGRVTVSGGTFLSLAHFTVGEAGAGYLELNEGEMRMSSPTGIMSIANQAGSTGSVVVNSGTMSGISTMFVGVSGSGSLSLSGGYLSSGAAALGVGTSGRGTATIDGGVWVLNGDLAVGAQGRGVLAINGGRVSQTGTTTLAAAPTSGSIFLTNSNGTAGIFETLRIVEGTGSGTVSFDGGILRALADEAAFVSGFEDGDLITMAGGAVIDSGTYAIGITSGLSGTGGLTKAGGGTLTLSGTSTYTGETMVQAGQLTFNGVSTGSGTVSVQSGAALGGNGRFAGHVTIADGGILTPGNSAGTLTVGSLTLGNTSEVRFELGTSSDLVVVTDALTLGGQLTVTALSGFGNGAYTLFQYGGALTNHGLNLESGPLGYYYSLDFSQAGSVRLLVDDAQYWDGSHISADGTVNGGSGTWNNATTNWTLPDGSANQAWSGSAVAVFSGSAGVVEVADTVGVKLIDFVTDGYTLTGTGSLAGGSPTLTLNTGTEVAATIHTNISGTATVVKGGSGGLVTLAGSNSYLGGTVIKTGTLAVGSNGSVAHANANLTVGDIYGDRGALVINGGRVSADTGVLGGQVGATGVATVNSGTWANATGLFIGRAGTGTLELIGGTVSIDTGAGNLDLGDEATSVGTLNIGTGGTAGTLQAASVTGGDGVATVNFNHTGSLTFASQLLGNLSVNKLAAGTTTLTGDNTYTGPTTINAGRLVVNGYHSGAGVVTVASGGTLAGSGTIAGAVTVQSGGTLALGDSTGSLTLTSTVSFASGSLFSLEGDGAFFTRLDVTGAVSIASGAQISFALLSPLTSNSYTLLTAAGGLDGSIPFTLMGAVPAGYELVYSGTSLRLVSRVEIGAITVTPEAPTIITGGTTAVTVAVENSGSPGSPDLEATVTGTGAITGSGTATVAAGATGTAAPNLAFSSTAIGIQSGTVTVSDPFANNNPQTGTTTVTVLDHSAPVFVISGSYTQSVIVGATGITATLNLANGTADEADRSPMTVQNLSTGLTGTTGVGVIASGESGTYTASLDTRRVGAAQTQVFTLEAGDQQSLPGAAPLTTQSGTFTLNVYGHAAPVLGGTTFHLGNLHVGYGSVVATSQTVTNGAPDDYIVDLKADGVTSGAISINGFSGLAAGNSASLTATFATGQGVGAINETLAYTFADDSTLAGASANVGTYTLHVTGQVYSGQGVWASMSGGTWGTLASNFGVHWQSGGGTPGLDAAFIDTDTATFGTAGAGVVTLDGAAPSLKGLRFDNASASYELRQGSGGAMTLNGGNQNALIESTSGTHAISIPVSLATDTTLSVATGLLAFTADSVVSGSGKVVKQGDGTVRFAGTNTYSGGTRIEAGTVATASSSALGTGAVTLGAGTLSPVGTLAIDSLTWSGGQLAMALGTSASLLDVAGSLTNGGAGGTFAFTEGAGFMGNTDYALLHFGALGGFTLADFTGNALYGITPTFSLVGDELLVRFDGASSGSILSNYTPVFTPLTADFQVNGDVRTSNAPNRVNSLAFADSSRLTVFNDLVITSGLFTVNSGSATLGGSGNVITPGGFTKLGGGLLNILSNLFINGDLQLQSGALAINGHTTVQNLVVQWGTILKGSGVISGNVFNHGVVAPGNSPGTLTFSGDFTQSGSGTLQIEIASATDFDRLVVGGNAQLAGELQVLRFGGYELEYGQQFAFLQAGHIRGAFDRIVTFDPSTFRARFLKHGGTGSILIAPASYTLVAQTPNQRSVAAALDRYIPAQGNDRETVSLALDHLSAKQYPAAFEQIMPGFYESLTDTAIEQAVMQNQLLAQRMSAVRLGARGFSTVGIESPLTIDRNGNHVMDARGGENLLAPTLDNQWGVWVQGNGTFAKVTNASQIPNYHTEAGGFLVGADYRWSESFATGVYAGYQGLSARYSGGSRMSINTALFGGYATYEKGGLHVDAMVGGGYNDTTARRSIEFGNIDRTARSTPNGGQFTTYLEAGYDWSAGGFTFGPIASAQYSYIGITPFTESGAESLNLRIARQDANSIRTNLGGRIAYSWAASEKVLLIPEVRLFWQHEFLQNSTRIGANLDGGAGPGFGYETSAPGRDRLFAGAGISAQFGKSWGGYLFYNADFARQDYRSHAISAGLNWKF